MMYNNLDEIEFDLKRLDLERKIALEEIKGLKQDIKDDLSPYNWLSMVLSVVKKYGVLYMVRKFLK